jgi:HSP20 family protein
MDKKIKIKKEKENQLKNAEESSSAETTASEATVSENKNGIFEPEGELVVDVYETNSDFVITSAIAGVQIKDIDISVDKSLLVIKGCRQNPEKNPEREYFYQECYWGPFSRKIVLPENIEIEKAAAEMDKGVLTIKIPKSEKDNSGKIGIKMS